MPDNTGLPHGSKKYLHEAAAYRAGIGNYYIVVLSWFWTNTLLQGIHNYVQGPTHTTQCCVKSCIFTTRSELQDMYLPKSVHLLSDWESPVRG